MQNITTPSISALESIRPDLLRYVSGGCGCKKHKVAAPPPPPPPQPPPPAQPPLPQVMSPPQEASGPQVINTVTITMPGGTPQRVA